MKRWILLGFIALVGATWPLVVWGQHKATEPPAHAPEHAAEGHGEHAEEGEEHELKPINWADFGNKETPPYVALVINFAILVGAFWYFGRKPIAEGLHNRRVAITKEIEEAQRMKHEAEERAKLYQAKLEKLEEELVVTKQALVEAGRGDKERIIREAEEKAVRMQKDAEFLIEQEMKQIRQDLWRETVEVAVTAAEELLKKRITASDQERLAEDYLSDLASQTRSATIAPKAGAT